MRRRCLHSLQRKALQRKTKRTPRRPPHLDGVQTLGHGNRLFDPRVALGDQNCGQPRAHLVLTMAEGRAHGPLPLRTALRQGPRHSHETSFWPSMNRRVPSSVVPGRKKVQLPVVGTSSCPVNWTLNCAQAERASGRQSALVCSRRCRSALTSAISNPPDAHVVGRLIAVDVGTQPLEVEVRCTKGKRAVACMCVRLQRGPGRAARTTFRRPLRQQARSREA